MSWTKVFGAAALAALSLMGCAGQGRDDEMVLTSETRADLDFPVLMVRILVMQQSDGSGNSLWTTEFIGAVVRMMQQIVGKVVIVDLLEVDVWPDDNLYELNQQQLLYRSLSRWQLPGLLTVVVSRPNTEDSAGVSTIEYATSPVVVVRSREQEWRAMTAFGMAEIILHEVGHQMSLRHHGQGVIGLPWTADDWHQSYDGLAYFGQWVGALNRLG